MTRYPIRQIDLGTEGKAHWSKKRGTARDAKLFMPRFYLGVCAVAARGRRHALDPASPLL